MYWKDVKFLRNEAGRREEAMKDGHDRDEEAIRSWMGVGNRCKPRFYSPFPPTHVIVPI